MQAIGATRAGGHVGYVGVNYDVKVPGMELFFAGIHLHGGPAPVRRFLPDLIQLIWDRKIDPGKVFDLSCRSRRRPRATGRWTSAAPPRSSSPSDPRSVPLKGRLACLTPSRSPRRVVCRSRSMC